MMDFRPLSVPAAGRAWACHASQKPQAHRETRRASGDDERPFCEISMQPTALFRRAVAESDACAQKHPQDESIAGILSKTAGYANGAHQCSRSFHIVLLFDHSVKGKSCRAGAGKGRKENPLPGTRQGRKEGRKAYAILKFNWTVYLRRFHLRIGLLLDIVHHSQGDFHVDVLALGDIVQGDVFAA